MAAPAALEEGHTEVKALDPLIVLKYPEIFRLKKSGSQFTTNSGIV